MNDLKTGQREIQTLHTLTAAQHGMPLTTDDVLVLVLPLFQEVAALHAAGKVAALDADGIVIDDAGALRLRQPGGVAPRADLAAVGRVQPAPVSGLHIVGALQRSRTADGMQEHTDLAMQLDVAAPVDRPVYLPGPASWELLVGHHDEISDVFLLGMVLAGLACGLDFANPDDLAAFVTHRCNLFTLHAALHPVIASVIVEMTELNRHQRATDVAALGERLRTWRDQPCAVDVDRALASASGAAPRRTAVLAHLRDRLFDLSRRNRLLYFRPTTSTVNLTVASVPLMLQLESVRPEHICTWDGPFAADVVSGKPVSLQRWLRFEDQPYLPASLDQLISETRRDRAEFGFSNLRLVLAFLRWHNLKEAPDERITTPLLWLPVELVKRKGVRDQYLLQCTDDSAEFNPVLRHHLHQLYDIQLPEKVDLDKTTLAEVHGDILGQIRRSEPSVELRLVDKAAIRLVRQKALQRMQQYQRRKGVRAHAVPSGLPPYSYAREDYRPLGRALFEQWVRPGELPQRFEAGASPRGELRRPQMVDLAEADARLGYVLEESEGHRYAWDLDLTQVTLANFNYKKMSLVRDYAQLLEAAVPNPAFDCVFSIDPRDIETAVPAPLAPGEQWSVVASDATQNAAVALARNQRSFIIQGPPGTGKSQTITNLIADYAGRGKRVLFVCEKRAALDVVFSRLRQSGLASLCCLIHDSQTDKKAFIADLKASYERWMAQADDAAALEARRVDLVKTLTAHQQRIKTLESAMAATPDNLGLSVRTLLRRVLELPAAPDTAPALREFLPTLANWDRQRELVVRLHRTMRERFGVDSLASHPFARLSAQLLGDEHAYGRAEQLCRDAEALFDSLEPLLERPGHLIGHDTPLQEACSIVEECHDLLESGVAAHLALLEPGSPAQAALHQVRLDVGTCTKAVSTAQAATMNWRDKLSPADTDTALALVQRLEPSLGRWFQPAWWSVRGEIKRRYDFAKHAIHPGYTKVVEALAVEHQAAAALADANAIACQRYGVTNMAAFLDAVADLERRLPHTAGVQKLVAYLRQTSAPVVEARVLVGAREGLNKLANEVRQNLALDSDTPLGEIAELLRDLREALDDLPDLLSLLRAVHDGDPACATTLQRLDHSPDELDALVVDEALRRLERAEPVLASGAGKTLAQAARTVALCQRELLSLNAQVVQATLHQQFTEHVRQSILSASQLDADGKAFKKRYATGRRELEREFGKTMRYRSIRDLSDDETGMVVNDLKPIWLMSPLSVSDTLPLSPDLFDVVIFDEASQISVEESVPALCRAGQVVIVGDEMQLPPTSFFSATGKVADNEIMVEEHGERIAINLDSDSLLSQAARHLPATLLAWHYRSRHESLISFSNAAFYEGRLVTIPDRMLEPPGGELAGLRSDVEDAGAKGADSLLARPISFHLVADGVYAERRNMPEARYIARMVRDILSRDTGLSLGVVAFSEAQQSAIESELEALAADDPAFAAQLEREYVREDDDQFNGLFVKNLENVQGDERDVIILSICYAPGPDGKMLMNFGPINQRGGEKRLNVIFSRSRHRMAVVSTIRADAITNVHNDGASALRAFLHFAEASATGQFDRAQAVLGALNPGAREAFNRQASADSIRDALATALRERGYEVHVNVGRSQLRCDLTIVQPSKYGYVLAILLDNPADLIGDTIERYVFRPGILRSFGWRVLDVLGKDWLDDPMAVLGRIETMLTTGEDRTLEDADMTTLPQRQRAAPPAPVTDSAPVTTTVTTEGPPDLVRSLSCEQGTSRKFWRVSVKLAELSITYGRIGSSGQVITKRFETAERATRELEKLVAEKLRKGYVEG